MKKIEEMELPEYEKPEVTSLTEAEVLESIEAWGASGPPIIR